MTSALEDPQKIGTDLPVALRRNRTDLLVSHFERTEAQSGERWRHAVAPFAEKAVAIPVDVLAEFLLTLKTAVQTIVQASLRGHPGTPDELVFMARPHGYPGARPGSRVAEPASLCRS